MHSCCQFTVNILHIRIRGGQTNCFYVHHTLLECYNVAFSYVKMTRYFERNILNIRIKIYLDCVSKIML